MVRKLSSKSFVIYINEVEDYSEWALDKYSEIGKVWTGKITEIEKSSVEILVVRLAEYLDKDYLSSFKSLKFIVTPTTGLTHIDLTYCEEKGIRIYSLNECSDRINKISSTSELTFGLILSLLRKIPKANSDVIEFGIWNRDRYVSRELSELTLGIVGLGRIGEHISKYAHCFGMQVLAFDPFKKSSFFDKLNISEVSLDTLLSNSDVITIHVNLNEDNHLLIGENEINLIKSDALIINTSRGELVDESYLAHCLRNGRLGGVAVDVLTNEQNMHSVLNSPLVKAARDGLNVIITPHIGGCTIDAMRKTENIMAEYLVEEIN